MIRWLWLSLIVVALDQISKQLVESNLLVFETLPLLSWLNLTLAYNEGAAFSFLSDQDGWQRWFFVALAVTVSIVLVVWLSRLNRSERLVATALSLLLGGALGNMIDRLRFGHVVDFIDVYYRQWHWPAFNVADSAITVGVILMLWDAARSGKENRKL
ncbi:MAG: lipoprotein signal peptidase [Gammaproteobacteria bacterium]|nr:lipoprotein signal peptidase [Gammaproteobacteria bacterium]